MVNQKVCKKKYLSRVYGVDRKICHSGSLFGITRQASWCRSVTLVTDFSIHTIHTWKILVGWLVVLGLTALWDSISVYIGPSPKEREKMRRERIDESKNVQTTPTRTYCKCSRSLPYCNPNCRTPRHWKFTQHHRTTRPPPTTPHMKDTYIITQYNPFKTTAKEATRIP